MRGSGCATSSLVPLVHLPDPTKLAREFRLGPRNALGGLALIGSATFTTVAVVAGSSLAILPWGLQVVLVAFLILHPIAVLGVFYLLVTRHHTKLYAPVEYRRERNFVGRPQVEAPKVVVEQVREPELDRRVQARVLKLIAASGRRHRELVQGEDFALVRPSAPANNVPQPPELGFYITTKSTYFVTRRRAVYLCAAEAVMVPALPKGAMRLEPDSDVLALSEVVEALEEERERLSRRLPAAGVREG